MERRDFFKSWAHDEHGHVDCWYCGVRIWGPKEYEEDAFPAAQIEHQTPVSRGGSNDRRNLVPACRACNMDKGTRTLDEYREVVFKRRLTAIWAARATIRDVERDNGWTVSRTTNGQRMGLAEWLIALHVHVNQRGPAGIRFAAESHTDAASDPYLETERDFFGQMWAGVNVPSYVWMPEQVSVANAPAVETLQ